MSDRSPSAGLALMTGEGEPFPDRIEAVVGTMKSMLKDIDDQIARMEGHLARLRKMRDEIEEMRL